MLFLSAVCTFSASHRRHLPPPPTNFEKLQDILLKRKGLKLDVSSSGALADSLDKCLVRCSQSFVRLCRAFTATGSKRTRFQHIGAHHGDEVYAVCGIFQFRQCLARYVRALRSCKPNLYTFYQSYPSLRRYVARTTLATFLVFTFTFLRCPRAPPARCRYWLYTPASISSLQNAR